MSYGIIYKITNKINGKIYIGQTTKSLNIRLNQHRHNMNKNINLPLYNSMRKYGESNFTYEVIDTAESQEDLDSKEMYWIEYLNSYFYSDNSNGYNMTIGGGGISGYEFSDEVRKNMSESRKGLLAGDKNPMFGMSGEKNPFYGKTHSEESKSKISNANKGRLLGKNHPNYGKPLPERTKRKISDSRKMKRMGLNNPNAKEVIQFTKSGEFIDTYETIEECASRLNINRSGISQSCNNKLKTYKGYIFLFKEGFNEDVLNDRVKSLSSHGLSRSVIQLSLDGSVISEYKSVKDGADAIDGRADKISACCRGERKTHKGFKWIYKDEYIERSEKI